MNNKLQFFIKGLLRSLFAIAIAINGYAQNAEVEWAGSLNGNDATRIHEIEVDQYSNIYVAGDFEGTVDFEPGEGQHFISSYGGIDAFFAKYDKGGKLIWIKHFGTAEQFERGQSLSLNHERGEVAISGSIGGVVDFGDGPNNQSPKGKTDCFIAVYDLDGNLSWAQTFGGSNYDFASEIKWHNNKLFVAGPIRTTTNINPTGNPLSVYAHSGVEWVFLAKYDEHGIAQWGNSFGRTDPTYIYDMAVGNDGNVFLTGNYTTSVNFSFLPGGNIKQSNGGVDGYVAKYNSDGVHQWVHSIGGTSNGDNVSSIAINGEEFYITGLFNGTVNFDDLTKAAAPVSSNGNTDVFVAKYRTTDGSHIWSKGFGGALWDEGSGITIGPFNNILLSGRVQAAPVNFDTYSFTPATQDAFWAELNFDGNVTYANILTGPGVTDNGHRVALDPNYNSIYLTGDYTGGPLLPLNYNGTVSSPPDQEGTFIYKISRNYYNLVQAPTYDCSKNTVQIPLYANQPLSEGVIAIDACISYDTAVLAPTKKVILGEVMLASGGTPKPFVDLHDNGTLDLTLYNDNGLPTISGEGVIAYIEFNVIAPNGLPENTILATSCGLWESHLSGTVERLMTPIDYIYNRDDRGLITYTDTGKPLKFEDRAPDDFNSTQIIPTDSTGTVTGSPILNTDALGKFSMQTAETHLRIARDIPGTHDKNSCANIDGVISGQDIYLARYVATRFDDNIPSLKLTPYKMLAMDVNLDGKVTGGDVGLILARSLDSICEFPQAWNYPLDGGIPTANSKDWVFVDAYTAQNDSSYQISSTYPYDDGVGYSRHRLPNIPSVMNPPTEGDDPCITKQFHGVLLGDVDGSWANADYYTLRSHSSLTLFLDVDHGLGQLPNMPQQPGFTYIPVKYSGADRLTAMDLWNLGEAETLIGAPVLANEWEEEYKLAHRNAPFRIVSYALKSGLQTSEVIGYLPVRTEALPQLHEHLAEAKALINGLAATIQVGQHITHIEEPLPNEVTLYPNPAANQITLNHTEWTGQQASIRVRDMRGRLIIEQEQVLSQQVSLDVSPLQRGAYLLEVTSQNQTWYGKFVKE